MSEQSLSKHIIEAIKCNDVVQLNKLFRANPEQVQEFTYFGGKTWLGYAALKGSIDSCHALVEIGLDVNQGDKRENSLPICSAAQKGHADVVRLLLDYGSNLDVSSSVVNPLFAAITAGSLECCRLLLEAGIDSEVVYNSPTMKDMNATAFSLMFGEKDIAKLVAGWSSDHNLDQKLEEAERIAEFNAKERSS